MFSIIILLSVMHIAQLIAYFYIGDKEIFDFIQLVDFDYEANLPSLYSSLAILFCAALLWVIALQQNRLCMPFKFHWFGLAIIFTFLGVDEAVGFHEEVGDFIEGLELFEATGVLYFAWVVPYGFLLFLFAISYIKFVFLLPDFIKIKFIIAGLMFIGGAVGLEIISATEADLHGTETIKYSVLYTIEELCEMFAILLFCDTLLKYIAKEIGSISFQINHL
jgi:hypothetical protein